MKEKERKEFIIKEIEAINEELDSSTKTLVLLKPYLKDLLAVAKGGEPSSY